MSLQPGRQYIRFRRHQARAKTPFAVDQRADAIAHSEALVMVSMR